MLDWVMTRLLLLGLAAGAAFCLSFGAIMLLRPWLARYALAQPNARSSHRHPTPQGAGLGVVAATLTTSWGVLLLLPTRTNDEISILLSLTAAMLVLGILGAMDDLRSLPAGLRLFVQAIALAALIAALPQDTRLLPIYPGGWSARDCLW